MSKPRSRIPVASALALPAEPPPVGNRRIEQGLQSRARLVAEARRLFERDGYAATSTEALLAATGLTRGALYHHFRDKKDLFVAVCDSVHAELAQAIESATAGIADPQAQLLAGSLAWIEAMSARARCCSSTPPPCWAPPSGRPWTSATASACCARPCCRSCSPKAARKNAAPTRWPQR